MGGDGLLNYHTWKVECSDRVHTGFLYQALQDLTYTIEHKAQGAAGLVHIQKGWIEAWEALMPPLVEQEAIAEVLLCWDGAIQKGKRLLAARVERKRGLMQRLLTGATRFPKFVQSGKKSRTRFGSFPADWLLTRTGKFLAESRIAGSAGNVARKISVKLYGKGACPRGGSRPGSESTRYYKRKAGQFIYSKLDFLNGAFAILPDSLHGYESTLDLPAFDVGESVDARWLNYFVGREEFYKTQLGLAAGGRKAKRVNPSEFLGIRIPLPGLDEQRQIAAVLETCDREIELLQKHLDALMEQKRGLMQKLLRGEVRMKVEGRMKKEERGRG
jgi:type I restriction enzyme S subunit